MTKSESKLPATYLRWLEGRGKKLTVAFADREWTLAGPEKLAKSVNISGTKAPYLEQVKLYVQVISEMTGEASTFDDQGKEVPFTKVATFLAIGEENEDVLCLDPAGKNAIWCFSPGEGGMLEKLAASLEAWLKKVE